MKKFALAILASAVLSACGSGGSDSNTESKQPAQPVANQSPTVSISSESSFNEHVTVTVTASANDSDGTISTYSWVQISGESVVLSGADSATLSFTAPTTAEALTLSFKVTVTDDDGAEASEEVSININPVNALPVAILGDDVVVNPDVAASLSGALSSDEDGTIESYIWSQTGGTEVTLTGSDTETLAFTPSKDIEGETLKFDLTVTDNEGATSTDSVQVYINQYPVAVAADYQIVETGYEVAINANDSTDDVEIVEFSWTQTAGSEVVILNANTATPKFTANSTGDEKLTFEVTVTDNLGLTDSDTVDIDVVKVNRFINDTGVTVSADLLDGNDDSCIANETVKHDCAVGRDANNSLVKVGGGDAAFDFTKLDASGNELESNATIWSCVRDNRTGLTWEVKTTDNGVQHYTKSYPWGGKGANGFSDTAKQGTYHEDWNSLVDYANENSLCGKADWSLPTVNELVNLSNKGKADKLIDESFFPNTISGRYWTANADATDSSDAWVVDFGNADDGWVLRSTYNRVRLVSGGEAMESAYMTDLHADSRYLISADGTVTDLDTGLMWTRCLIGQEWDSEVKSCSGLTESMRWGAALESAEGSNLAGYSNWRIPNVNELRTIFALNKSAPSVNATAFTEIGTGSLSQLWSSTPDLNNNFNRYSYVVSSSGAVATVTRTSAYYTILVRNLH